MKAWEALAMSLAALGANKLRSTLTVLGIIIGVAAVIALMSLGQGAQATITGRIQAAGSNLVFVYPGAAQQSGVRGAPGTAASLTLEDAEALADPGLVPAAALVAPEMSSRLQVAAAGQNYNARVVGVTPEYLVVRNQALADGSFLQPYQLTTRSSVAVLGKTVAETLFGEGGFAVGQTIRIAQQPYRVVGVLEAKGGGAFGSQDDAVLVPITNMMQRLMAQRTARGALNVSTISVQARDGASMVEAKEQVAAVLRDRHRIIAEDDFTVLSQEDLVSALEDVTNLFTIFLGSIAGISLVVGGIGIMNVMLVSVTERTREIGIRKALGAQRGDIVLQFLVEASLLSLTGGLLGIGLGWLISQALGRLQFQGQSIATVVSLDVVVLAVTVSIVIGLFFGIYPALRAARLHPIEALRHE